MLTHITRDPAAAIARLGALLLIAASAALGTTYAYALGAHFGPWVAYAFAAMALGGELVKPVRSSGPSPMACAGRCRRWCVLPLRRWRLRTA